jgi:hypothetical protein
LPNCIRKTKNSKKNWPGLRKPPEPAKGETPL